MKYHDAIKQVSIEYLADAVRFIKIAADKDDPNTTKKDAAEIERHALDAAGVSV